MKFDDIFKSIVISINMEKLQLHFRIRENLSYTTKNRNPIEFRF